ncbi:unnamed protein product [Orchesella dallaii]|uniref:Ig-like domain-containing protein n=1 Tax=Orchesella dallaii TaxID=48710 RepID=A0ABP1QFW8_9HEXA
MFSSFPFRVECRPTRAMGPGPPYIPGTGVLTSPQFSSSSALGIRGSGRLGVSNCPVLEGPSATRYNPWPELYVTDITMKAWDTSLVLEGMARSRSEVRSDGTYGVTFDLIRVVKGNAPLLRRLKQFRLQFLDNPSPPAGNQSEPGNTATTTSSSGGSPIRSSSSNNVNSNHHNHNYNRALGVRSNSNSNHNNNQRNSQLSSSARVSNSGTISLKSNLHSSYVNLHNSQQQQQQQLLTRRGYSSSSSSSASSPSSTSSSSSSRVRNNNPSLSQTVQFNQQYVRNYHTSSNHNNFTVGSGGSRSKNMRIARSHQQQLQQYDNGRHARHGRVGVGPHNNIVNSASTSSGGTGKCLPPRATVKTGRKYFVFAAKVETHFVAVFSPELANKRNTKAVESILCKGCGQAPSVVAAKEVVLQPKERLRIRCRLRAGNPIPVLTWYKDGRLVNLTDPRYRLRAKRRQSVLVIRKAKEMDTGVYKCEAKNVFGSAHATTRVSISQQPQKPIKPPSPKPVGTTPTTLWAVPSSVCPFDSYCLNGGTCSYYETIGEYVCQSGHIDCLNDKSFLGKPVVFFNPWSTRRLCITENAATLELISYTYPTELNSSPEREQDFFFMKKEACLLQNPEN